MWFIFIILWIITMWEHIVKPISSKEDNKKSTYLQSDVTVSIQPSCVVFLHASLLLAKRTLVLALPLDRLRETFRRG